MFRWCSYEFRLVGRDTQLEVGATMREVVRRLRARPELLRWVLFQSPITSTHTSPTSEALSILSQTLQSTLLNTFLAALTHGSTPGSNTNAHSHRSRTAGKPSNTGGGRPIELHAHDPLRYIGDMLAWVHQAIAGASEFLEGLFGIGIGAVNANANAKDGTEGVEVGGRMVGSVRRRGGTEEEGWVRELLDVAVEKMCLPLKVRLCVCVPNGITE